MSMSITQVLHRAVYFLLCCLSCILTAASPPKGTATLSNFLMFSSTRTQSLLWNGTKSASIYCESWMFLRTFSETFIMLSWKVCWHFPLFVGFMVYLWRRRTVSAILSISVQDHCRPVNWLELYLEETGCPESQTIHESSWPHPQSGVLFDALSAALSCPPRRTNRFSNSCIPSAFIQASECWDS